MIRYLSIAERHALCERAGAEQSAGSRRLDEIAQVLDEAPPPAANQNLPARTHVPTPSSLEGAPPLLQRNKVVEYALIDGYCDAAMGKPMMISSRFVEALLHIDNMVHFDAYSTAYQESWTRHKEQNK